MVFHIYIKKEGIILKKLLSLLTVVLISSGTVSSITSCSAKESLNGLKTDLQSDTLVTGTAASLYNNIDTKIADYLKKDHKDITVDDVKNDKKLSVVLMSGKDTLPKDSTTPVLAGLSLNLNLDVKSGDKYFKANSFSLAFTVDGTFTGKITDMYNVTNGTTAYEKVRTYLVNSYNQNAFPGKQIKTENIKNDNNIQIAIWNGNEMIADNDGIKIEDGTTLTVKFTILEHDIYFASFPQTDFTVTSYTGNMPFDITKIIEPTLTAENGQQAYFAIRTAIANAYGSITSKDIKDDNNIQIAIWSDANTQVNDDLKTPIAFGQSLDVKVKVLDNDNYFLKTDNWQIITVKNVQNFTKNIIPTNIIASTGSRVYYEIRTAIAKAYNKNITAYNIKQDDNIQIAIWNNGAMIEDNDTKIADSTIITVKITILPNDLYFASFPQTNFDVAIHLHSGQISFDINKIIEPTLTITNGEQTYDAIRTAIANAYGNITSTEIRNDNNIQIAIWSDANTQVNDDSTSLIAAGQSLDVKVKVLDNDSYFVKTDNWQIITVKNLKDFTNTIIPPEIHASNGKQAYDAIRTFMASAYGNITLKNIKADNNIQIAIWNGNQMIADNDGIKIEDGTTLTIKITILENDLYFASFPQTDFTSNVNSNTI